MLARIATAGLFVLAASWPVPSHAFLDTVPFVWWSKSPAASSSQPARLVRLTADDAQNSITPFINKCPKAIVLFDQLELHSDDIVNLPEKSTLKKLAEDALISVHYVDHGVDVDKIVSRFRKQCDAESVEIDATTGGNQQFEFQQKDHPQIVLVRADANRQLTDIDKVAKDVIASVEYVVADDYSVVLTASRATPSAKAKRGLLEGGSHKFVKRATNSSTNSTLPTVTSHGGLFGTFVIFGPGVWMGFFAMSIVVPIVFAAVILMNGIQTPIRFEKKPKNIK